MSNINFDKNQIITTYDEFLQKSAHASSSSRVSTVNFTVTLFFLEVQVEALIPSTYRLCGAKLHRKKVGDTIRKVQYLSAAGAFVGSIACVMGKSELICGMEGL